MDIEVRLNRLERSNRSLKAGLLGLGSTALMLCILGAATPPQEIITAKRFVLVDSSGKARAELSANDKAAALQFINSNGTSALVIASGSTDNGVYMFDKTGQPREAMIVGSDGGASLSMLRDSAPRETLVITDNPKGTVLAIRDGAGHELVDLGTANGGGLSITDANGIPRVLAGDQGLMAFDEHGNVYWTTLGQNMTPEERKRVMDLINATQQITPKR